MSQALGTNQSSPQNDLIVEYYPMARAIAGSIHRRLPPGVDVDDLIGAAVGGLVDAAERFDPSRAISFKSFAKHRIHGAVMDSLRTADWVPRSVRKRADALDRARARLADRFGRAPNRQEIAEYLEIAPDELDEMVTSSEIRPLLSLDAPLADENSASLSDTVAEDFDFTGTLQSEQLRGLAIQAIEALPERERAAIHLYYFEELSLKEVGTVLDVTESRACQLCTQAIKRLRTKLAPHLRG